MAFVGRERELAQLAEAVHRVAEGQHGRVVLTGPAGFGSTRLLDELSSRVRQVPGVLVCRGRAYEPTAGEAYGPVGSALEDALDDVDDARLPDIVGRAGHDLALVVPRLARRLDRLGIDHAAPPLRADDQLGRRIVESLLGTLERLADGGVLLLVLEDIHFADPASRGFVDAVMNVGGTLPICLVVTYHPDEIHRRHPARRLIQHLAEDPDVVRIELGPLSDQELEKLADTAFEERPPGNVMAAVLEGAGGNPLEALQLLVAARTLAGVRLSDPFDELAGARLEALSGEAARLVRLLAASRQPFKRVTLLAIARSSTQRVTPRGLDEALRSGLAVEVGERVAIAHELYAEAIQALELTPERHALNAAIATQMEDARPALAAWHWQQAARRAEARAAHLRAAERTMRVDPGGTALYHYEQALELPPEGDAGRDEGPDALAGAARASATAGSFRRAAALMRRAIERRAALRTGATRGARDEATRMELADMIAEQGRYEWAGGSVEASIATMERALEVVPTRPSQVRGRLQATLAQHLMIDGRFADSAVYAEAAVATARDAAGPDGDGLGLLAHATCTLGVDLAYLGDLERGFGLLEEASRIAREAGRLDDLMRVAANRTTLLDLDARREEALAVVQESLDDAATGGLTGTYGSFLRANAADILYELGRWTEAEHECRIALEWRTRRPDAAWFQPLLILGLLLTESRADDEAEHIVGQALLQLETVGAGQWTGLILRSAVSLALWTGKVDEALAIAEREWPLAVANGEPGMVGLAAFTCLEAAAAAVEHGSSGDDAGLVARARALADVVVPEAEARIAASSLDPRLGARVEAELALETARAHLARVRGRPSPDAWEAVARGWRARSMPYREAKARWWQALAILDTAKSEREREAARLAAREPLAAAYRIALELPAEPLLRAVVDLALRARIAIAGIGSGRRVERVGGLVPVGPGLPNMPVAVGPGRGVEASASEGRSDLARAIEDRVLAALRRDTSDAYGLSPREREVLMIVAEGRTDRDIAARLFISERTVHVHVRRILSKLGVSSRTEAAGVAIRQGLVPLATGSVVADRRGPDDVASAP